MYAKGQQKVTIINYTIHNVSNWLGEVQFRVHYSRNID